MKKKEKSTKGRKRIGQPISITLTDEQREWIESQIIDGEPKTLVIRKIINEAMKRDKEKSTTN